MTTSIVLAVAADPREGLQSIWLGVIVVLAFVIALNYKRLSVILALVGVMLLSSTVVYAPASMWESFGDAGAGVFEWMADQL